MFRHIVCLLAIFSFSLPAAPENSKQQAIVVVEHWPPWETVVVEEQGIVTDGLAIEIIEELFSRLGMRVRYLDAPFGRAMYMIRTGQADLIPMVVKDAEREVQMLFTEPIYKDRLMFIYSTDRFDAFEWQNWQDLKPFKIGLTRGYSYGELGKRIAAYEISTEVVATDKQNLRKLVAGRIDISPIFYVNAVSTFKEIEGYEKLKFSSTPIETKVFHFAISRKSPLAGMLNEINQHILDMKADGTFKRILGDLYVE
ncbi:substrate-binding periplasmic protein [Vibrio sp. SCSIO 43137]|uniref:substrate-binding periplasmic protein n=1 Tax=Vibrio sp. SCSIO 43137 TaxID=3021011 RepID=UPI00230810DE|nr:transporter substrate-binding domain-containing protein [Vibrio sp. SCSIO 43137]WCE29334.1 transporter substrate-binding domain-containing protein [Vibrio sp. SCSIO 43137]